MRHEREQRVEKVADILVYILKLLGGEEYSKTKLIKLLYLLDFETLRSAKKSFTGLSYRKYYYGPYSEEIDEAISLLKKRGIVEVDRKEGMFGQTYYVFRLKRDIESLSQAEKEQIEKRLRPYLNKSLNKILNIVYATKPVRQAEFGQEISFH